MATEEEGLRSVLERPSPQGFDWRGVEWAHISDRRHLFEGLRQL